MENNHYQRSQRHKFPSSCVLPKDKARLDQNGSLAMAIVPVQSPLHQPKRPESAVVSRARLESGSANPQSMSPKVSRPGSLFRLRSKIEENAPYHVFPFKLKRFLICVVSFAALFSPLSSNIYFPALGNIAVALNVTISEVNLSVTSYMIFQGLAPSFWGTLADAVGRRPVFIATFCVYEAANIGLALSKDLATLMVFRAIQAIGSSATISIGAGVIADITTPDERGGLIGTFGGIRMLGQAIGPVFGGVLAQYLGFHSIFYFLLILAAIACFAVLLFLPETLRSIAGNGTIRLRGIYRPWYHKHEYLQNSQQTDGIKRSRHNLSWGAMFDPARILVEKDVFVTLFFGGIVYAVWSMVTASTTNLFQSFFHLSDAFVGLAFVPNGIGCVLGSYIGGKVMDHDFKILERRYRLQHSVPEAVKFDKASLKEALQDFPIERARTRNMWWHVVIFCGATAGYGFSLSTHLALPLILQLLIAYTATAIFSFNSTLIIDLYPGKSASATAVNNLMRCMLGALGVAVIDVLIIKAGVRIIFACLAGLTAGFAPLILVEWIWGTKWRLDRENRLADLDERP